MPGRRIQTRCDHKGAAGFNIGGDKYRVIVSVDFREQVLVIERILTHEQYDRETIF